MSLLFMFLLQITEEAVFFTSKQFQDKTNPLIETQFITDT